MKVLWFLRSLEIEIFFECLIFRVSPASLENQSASSAEVYVARTLVSPWMGNK